MQTPSAAQTAAAIPMPGTLSAFLYERWTFCGRMLNAHNDLVSALLGARDMHREAAKQFRVVGDNGHAVMCDHHADNCEAALAKAGAL